jgi:hypothetical protein
VCFGSERMAAMCAKLPYEVDPPKGSSRRKGGCGNQFVESRWPYLDGLVSLDGHVVGAGLGIRWRRRCWRTWSSSDSNPRAFATSEFERQALDLDH